MAFDYRLKDVMEATGKSPQALHSLMKNNKTLKALLPDHSERMGKSLRFDETIYKWFLAFYGADRQQQPQKGPETAPEARAAADGEQQPQAATDGTEAEISRLQAEIKRLKQELDKSESERKQALEREGALIIMLREEQTSLKRLLPAPVEERQQPDKITLRQRIKGLFFRK